jgi:Na+/proline symporter
MLLSFASHGADYMMVQRVLSCRDLRSAQKAIVGSGIFVFIQFAVFLLAGSLIYLYLDGAPLVKDREFSTFIVNELPVGLKGLLLAGVLSAAMSTLSSSINSLASSTTTDWLANKVNIRTSRLVSLGWAIVLIGIALVFDESDKSIVEMGLQIASFTYGGLLGLFLLTKWKRKFSEISLVAGLVASMLIVFVLKYQGLAWTWFIGFSVLVNILVAYGTDWLVKLRQD